MPSLERYDKMVGRMLLYAFMVGGLMLGQRVSNEQINAGPTEYVDVGPTVGIWLANG